MTLSNPYDGERRAGTVGLPLPASSRASPRDGTPCRMATTGELLVQGTERLRRLLESARRDRRSVHATAGSAPATSPSVPTDGYYTLLGRQSDLIISGGFNIYPREIEELLAEHPGVAEAAVAGWPTV